MPEVSIIADGFEPMPVVSIVAGGCELTSVIIINTGGCELIQFNSWWLRAEAFEDSSISNTV